MKTILALTAATMLSGCASLLFDDRPVDPARAAQNRAIGLMLLQAAQPRPIPQQLNTVQCNTYNRGTYLQTNCW